MTDYGSVESIAVIQIVLYVEFTTLNNQEIGGSLNYVFVSYFQAEI